MRVYIRLKSYWLYNCSLVAVLYVFIIRLSKVLKNQSLFEVLIRNLFRWLCLEYGVDLVLLLFLLMVRLWYCFPLLFRCFINRKFINLKFIKNLLILKFSNYQFFGSHFVRHNGQSSFPSESHLSMQCKWKWWLHLPCTGTQSSPGVLHFGQGVSKSF